MTDADDRTDTAAAPDQDRTVTITGVPLLLGGLVAFLTFRRVRRRRRRHAVD